MLLLALLLSDLTYHHYNLIVFFICTRMENQTMVNILFLTELSDIPSLQLLLFLMFLLVYLMTLIGNLIILSLVVTDSSLKTPMYFFLGTLACLDMSYSSVTTPRMIFDLFTGRKIISVKACITQVYFFLFFSVSEVFLLAVMSYDRYVAICRPLYYMQIMSWKVCAQFVSCVLVSSAVYSFVHIYFLAKLSFCIPNILQSFFCDLPLLLQISCSDTFINVLLILLFGMLFGGGFLVATFSPYTIILATVLKIPSENMRSKALSTCSSHLTVVFIFYGSLFFNYLRPNAKYRFREDKVASVFYAILTPFLNPLLYSLRNQQLKTSLRRTLRKL